MPEIRETFRVRRAVKGNANVETRIANTFDQARRIAERESAAHAGAYVVDAKTNLTDTFRPVAVFRAGKLQDES